MTNGEKQNTYGVKQKINGVKQNTNGVMQSSCGAKHKISEGKQFAKKVRQSVNGGKKNLNWQIREGKRAIRSIWKEVFTTWSRKKKLRKAKNLREGFIFMDSWQILLDFQECPWDDKSIPTEAGIYQSVWKAKI